MILAWVLVAGLTKTFFSSEVTTSEPVQPENPHLEVNEKTDVGMNTPSDNENSGGINEEVIEESNEEKTDTTQDYDSAGNPTPIGIENESEEPASPTQDLQDQTEDDAVDSNDDSQFDNDLEDLAEDSDSYRDLAALTEQYRRRAHKTFEESRFSKLRDSKSSEEREDEEEFDNGGKLNIGPPIYFNPRNPNGERPDKLEPNEMVLYFKLKFMEFMSICLANLFSFMTRICEFLNER
ncbi:hypothetical protein RF11_09803 [Thelohanellus kitauei]|uniref:Uncharacterized protein n=1 Tax=Thelohanellus kitauei TaxID=669202 RepID=A0A0C2NA28_THEKT|nr:hypothetical protein RF11_09803 [Thelohanellus kitauei]